MDYKLPQPERKVVSTSENFTEHRKLENARFLTGKVDAFVLMISEEVGLGTGRP